MFRNQTKLKADQENLKDFQTNMVATGEKIMSITGLAEEDIYFEPGDTTRLRYPCIIFEPNNLASYKGSNKTVFRGYSYIVTYITRNSTDPVIDKLQNSELCYYNGRTIYDNLYHYRFSMNGTVI